MLNACIFVQSIMHCFSEYYTNTRCFSMILAMPLASTENQAYQLNLEPQKRNVFVTQLNDQANEDDDIRRFAVVKETADKLLHTGINTLQKTSLLRKAVEVEETDRELAEKREEFRQRMARNKIKEEALRKKQEKIRERVTKFDRFLKDNDAKRARAMRKYQLEVRDNKLRSRELVEVKAEVVKARERKEAMLKKLEAYKKYEAYLMRVIDVLPENFLEMTGENMIQSLIHRYEAQAATHDSLMQRNQSIAGAIEAGQRELEDLKHEREQQKLVINSQMAELQNYQETLTQHVQRLEQEVGDTTSSHRSLVGELGQIRMAIDNIAEGCHARHFPPLGEMSHVAKLTMINQHFSEQTRVVKLIQRLAESRRSSTSSGAKPFLPKIAASASELKQQEGHTAPNPSALPTPADQVRRRAKHVTGGFIEQLKTISESKTE